MKSITKLLLVGAIAVLAIAVTAVPSDAAKKKKMAAAAAPAPCAVGTICKGACDANQACQVNVCAADGKWTPAFLTPVCFGPACPAACQ